MARVAFHTLGCKVNQVETEGLKEVFLRKGYQIVDFLQAADVYVINTCTVTHVSDRKSRALIRRARKINPNAVVVAAGCLAQVNPDQLAELEGINLIVGNGNKERVADLVENYLEQGKRSLETYVDVIPKERKPGQIIYSQLHERTRAFVKIQDGCQSYCSYCIVPYARGPVRSKSPEDVLEEIGQLLDLGYKEIVLTGIHSGFYGIDIEGWDLHRLLDLIFDRFPGDYRIRLSSIEPVELTRPLVNLAAAEERMCRHFHIPLQSGSDRILKDMRRRYQREDYRRLVEETAALIPGAAFTTDVMVGFPGESELDFQDSYDLINELPFYRLHVFKYSRRQGTPAAEMENQVDEDVKNRRSEILLDLGRKKRISFEKRFIGTKLRLLVEQYLGDYKYIGISDNYIEVLFESRQDFQGQMIDAIVQEVRDNGPFGNLCIK